MAFIAFTKDLFLWLMSIIYLFAFSSLYVQIPGLYGDSGLMPARLVIEKEATSWDDLLSQPTLLKLTPRLGLDTQTAMDLLCLAGILISLYCLVCHKGRNFVSFFLLWILYLSLYQKFESVYFPEENVCIDEAMCPWRGRGGSRVYMREKPTKWGIKLYELCESSSGYVYTFEVMCHQPGVSNSPHDVCHRLMGNLKNQGRTLYIDNYYCCPTLAHSMAAEDTAVVGTVRANRVGMPKDLVNQPMRRGDVDYRRQNQVGQTFLWFQWDILLLETGFLTLLLAPFTLPFMQVRASVPHDYLMMWLIRWLLFRLMFASGIVKLTSMCPTWWGLTALSVHFESQCIPTPLAWYWHHFPAWFLKLGVVATFVIEIPIPFLFFAPVRALRIFSFITQVLLQILIILTGNYNFFNLLTIALCVPLLDDSVFCGHREKGGRHSMGWKLLNLLTSIMIPGALLGYLAYHTQKMFDLQIAKDYSITSRIVFKDKTFLDWLEWVMPWTIRLGAASLALEILQAIARSFSWYKGIIRKNLALIQTLFCAAIAVAMFGISLVPHTGVHKPLQRNLDPKVLVLQAHTRPFHLVSSYGLFRRMTGVGGRPEVVVEGSYELNKGWKEYNFLYKPGNLSTRPPIVAPHQPRLDWQMWFAALSNYQNNPWFVTLVYRLLNNQPEVLQLMGDNPFPDKPPNYVRATLYHYHFTSSNGSKDWWTRNKQAEYIPAIAKDQQAFKDFLKHYRILEKPGKAPAPNMLSTGVQWIRQQVGQPEGFTFVMSIFSSGLLINLINVFLF